MEWYKVRCQDLPEKHNQNRRDHAYGLDALAINLRQG